MASSFAFKQFQRTQLSSLSHCKYSSNLYAFQFPLSFQVLSFSFPKHSLNSGVSSFFQVKAHVAPYLEKKLSEELSTNNNINTFPSDDISSGFSSSTSIHQRAGRIFLEKNLSGGENMDRKLVLRDGLAKNGLNSKSKKQVSSGVCLTKFTDKKLVKNNVKTDTLKVVNEGMDKRLLKCESKLLKAEKKEKRMKIPKVDSSGASLKLGLDLCSKRGDVLGAIMLYDLAKKEGIEMGEYHHAVLLYLCSSAATGIVQPAKSGSANRSLIHVDPSKKDQIVDSEALNEFCKMEKRKSYATSTLYVQDANENPQIECSDRNEFDLDGFPARVALGDSNSCFNGEDDPRKFFNSSMEIYPEHLNGLVQSMKRNATLKIKDCEGEGGGVRVSDDVKRFALRKGFEIFNEICREKVPMNEATFTSVARMAMAFGNGDMAFDMVKQMKEYGLNPRLRSYGPALTIFCNNGDVEKALMVEEHMLKHGVYPEEPELEMLLKVSIEAGKSNKVYYVLHKLRTNVRQVSPSIANLIERWFKSKVASRVGKTKWDHKLIVQAIENGGGGWHGKGWLGKGKWTVCHSFVGSDGLCKCCGEKLVTIDLDPGETENFAKSVASIASQREKKSSFQKFQKWLEYYGPFDAVVDGANVGLYSQRRFKPSKVNAVVNGIRQMLPSRKWPLIILHNRRITGEKMDEPINRTIIEKWKNADALYATPTGSNDDWYWLYAAIKCRCLLVTNDEMRDHLFQLLGNDFFPKWKERHLVHFSFDETGPVFHMPPPYSVVIQESEKGHWHIPIVSELEQEDQRMWLCCARAGSRSREPNSEDLHEVSSSNGLEKQSIHFLVSTESHHQKGEARLGSREQLQELRSNIETTVILSLSVNHQSILQQLEAAEKLGTCLIDFQI